MNNELKALNGQFALRGPRTPKAPVVIITIDEDSFAELNMPWPWPRALHAKLIDIVMRGKPAAIALDILFLEPSARGPRDDEALAQAIARSGKVVLAAGLSEVRESGWIKEKRDLNPPLPLLREGAAAWGPVNIITDRDAFVRVKPASLSTSRTRSGRDSTSTSTGSPRRPASRRRRCPRTPSS